MSNNDADKELLRRVIAWMEKVSDSTPEKTDEEGISLAKDLYAALEQPEQEPVAIHQFRSPYCADWYDGVPDHHDGHGPYEVRTLYTTPPQRKPLTDWIDPNDKTQERFLPNIGEPVLFCHEGKTYYGKHNGGSFQHRGCIAKQYFNTWECRWMYLPAAHGIKGKA